MTNFAGTPAAAGPSSYRCVARPIERPPEPWPTSRCGVPTEVASDDPSRHSVKFGDGDVDNSASCGRCFHRGRPAPPRPGLGCQHHIGSKGAARGPPRMDETTFPNAGDALIDSKAFFPVEFQNVAATNDVRPGERNGAWWHFRFRGRLLFGAAEPVGLAGSLPSTRIYGHPGDLARLILGIDCSGPHPVDNGDGGVYEPAKRRQRHGRPQYDPNGFASSLSSARARVIGRLSSDEFDAGAGESDNAADYLPH
jgi:hypothetical protein